MHVKSLTLAAVISTAVAQNASFCDKYTTALFMNNTAENQLKLLTAVVNTAVIGNFSESKTGMAVPGILAKGTYNGEEVNLAPYFSGALKSSNRGGSMGVAVNFLDGGGATPLMAGMASNDTESNQHRLLTHLYEYFGALLQCSEYGMSGYPAYDGFGSQYEVHKFMNLGPAEVGYFIQQVAGAAASFGVSSDDLAPVGMALNSLFGYKCSPPTTVIPDQGPQLQSICAAQDCPIAPVNASCPTNNITDPVAATAGGASPSSTGSMPSSTPTTVSGNGAATVGMSLMAVFGGLLALCL